MAGKLDDLLVLIATDPATATAYAEDPVATAERFGLDESDTALLGSVRVEQHPSRPLTLEERSFVYAGSEKQLFDFGGAGIYGIIAVVAGYLVSTALHELAHALAVKSYGRRVNRGGFLVMMGMPFAFVDTSDMWFGTSWSRIVVAVSGPLTTAGIAGGLSIATITVPDPRVAGVCYTMAAGLYLNTLFNLIPLIPLDGYQAFADALRTPRLKEEAKSYLCGGSWPTSRLAGVRAPSRSGTCCSRSSR